MPRIIKVHPKNDYDRFKIIRLNAQLQEIAYILRNLFSTKKHLLIVFIFRVFKYILGKYYSPINS